MLSTGVQITEFEVDVELCQRLDGVQSSDRLFRKNRKISVLKGCVIEAIYSYV